MVTMGWMFFKCKMISSPSLVTVRSSVVISFLFLMVSLVVLHGGMEWHLPQFSSLCYARRCWLFFFVFSLEPWWWYMKHEGKILMLPKFLVGLVCAWTCKNILWEFGITFFIWLGWDFKVCDFIEWNSFHHEAWLCFSLSLRSCELGITKSVRLLASHRSRRFLLGKENHQRKRDGSHRLNLTAWKKYQDLIRFWS